MLIYLNGKAESRPSLWSIKHVPGCYSPPRGTFCRATCWSCRMWRQSLRQLMVASDVALSSRRSWSSGEGPWLAGRPSMHCTRSLCWPCAWLIICTTKYNMTTSLSTDFFLFLLITRLLRCEKTCKQLSWVSWFFWKPNAPMHIAYHAQSYDMLSIKKYDLTSRASTRWSGSRERLLE